MKTYVSLLKMRFINGLQYRVAAYAGMTTQFAWGFMTILMFRAFYRTGADRFPMSFQALCSYIWLQQALLSLFMAWLFENDIFDNITSGNIAYELCRPVDIYNMWFVRSVSSRLSKAVLRCFPIFLVCSFLPKPYGIMPPAGVGALLLFLLSLTLGFCLVVAYGMLVYISTFYTISPMGVRIISVSLVEMFSGAIIPLPFLPDGIRGIFNLLPFASMQSTPFLIYNGYVKPADALAPICLQAFWVVFLVAVGRLIMRNALKRVVVQGG